MKQDKFKPDKEKNVNVRFTLRVPEDVYEEISTYAQQENISMNNLIVSCIRYAMKNRK